MNAVGVDAGRFSDRLANQNGMTEGEMMRYTHHYASPLGGILLASDGEGLTGLWFEGQKYYARGLGAEAREKDLPVFSQAARWLDTYFSGKEPDSTPPLRLIGTPFQITVWEKLLTIPYGETETYGGLARRCGLSGASARAVGSAVGRNPVSVIVPCHRVVGADGSLTGYAGGTGRKAKLLALERTVAGGRKL